MLSAHECSICYNRFDYHKHRPLILPCGHTWCKACLQHEKREGTSQCFLDRKAFPAVSRLATNFILLQTDAEPIGSEQAATPEPQDAAGAHAFWSWLVAGLVYFERRVLHLFVAVFALSLGLGYGGLISEGSSTSLGPVSGVVMSLILMALGFLIINTFCEGTEFTYWSATEVNFVRIATAASLYYATLSWVAGWHTAVCGLALPCFAALLTKFGVPYLYGFLDARHRGIPNWARQRAGMGGNSAVSQFSYILRLGAVLVGRWSPADAHGFIACCAAGVWLCAAFGPRALLLVAAWAVLTVTISQVVELLSGSWSLLKHSWDMVADAAQESDWVTADTGLFLMLAGSSVCKYGGCCYVLHYASTICLVVWLCTCTSSCADKMSRLLTTAADKAQWHLPAGVPGDRVLMRWAASSCFMAHMLYVCWVYPWLLVPFIGLGAVLSSGMCCTCGCGARSRCSCRSIFSKLLAAS